MYKGLCVLNMKGGVGKTTVAVNLGWAAAAAGLKCLVVDLDPQFNASVYLMGTGAYENHITSGGLTVFDIFEEHTPMRDPQRARPSGDNVIYTAVRASYRYKGEVHVIPSQLELAMTLKNPSGKSHLLSTFLSQHANNYDLVIVDPPPTDSMATDAAYLATNYVLVPVRPEFLSSIGFPLLAQSVRSFKQQYPNHPLDVIGVFLANVRPDRPEYGRTKEATTRFASSQTWNYLTHEIRFSDSYPRGSREASSIVNTDHARQYVKREFVNFAKEVFERMGL